MSSAVAIYLGRTGRGWIWSMKWSEWYLPYVPFDIKSRVNYQNRVLHPHFKNNIIIDAALWCRCRCHHHHRRRHHHPYWCLVDIVFIITDIITMSSSSLSIIIVMVVVIRLFLTLIILVIFFLCPPDERSPWTGHCPTTRSPSPPTACPMTLSLIHIWRCRR